MNLRPRIILKALREAIFPQAGGWGWTSRRTQIQYAQEVGDGLSSSVVVAPIGWLQRNFPEAPPRIRKRNSDGTLTPLPEHRLLELLDNPNDFYGYDALMQATLASYILDGNGYWQIVRNASGAPIQLWWVPHGLITPYRAPDSTNFIDYYKYRPNGIDIPLAVEDVVHFRFGIDTQDNMRGMSRFHSLLREIFTDDEAAAFTASLLRNMGVPGLIASPAESSSLAPAPDGNVQEIKRRLEQMTTGANRGKPLVIGAPTKIEQFGFSPQQMNLKDLRRLPEERVTAVIGVPAIVCGLGAGLDRSTYSNMAEAREAAYEETVIPMQREFAAVIEKQLLPSFESQPRTFKVDFDLSEVRVLQEDENRTAARVQLLVTSGVMTVAEAREPFGLPIDDSQNVYLRPLNLIETPQGTPAPAKEHPGTGLKTPTERCDNCGYPTPDHCQCPKTNGSDPKGRGNLHNKAKLPRAAQQRLMQTMLRQAIHLAEPFAKELAGHFDDLGSLAARAWRDASSAQSGKELNPIDMSIIGKALANLGIDEWQSSVMGAAYAKQYQRVAGMTIETLGTSIGLSIDAPDVIAQQVLRTGGTRLGLVDLTKQTTDTILKAVEEGRAAGLGAVAIERGIRDHVSSGLTGQSFVDLTDAQVRASVKARALRIARTETMHAQRVSLLASYEASGAYDTLIAYDNRIGYTGPDPAGSDGFTCDERDGMQVTFDQAQEMMDAEHPNGSLSFAPGSVRS